MVAGKKEFDIVIYGAAGFTGSLATTYLASVAAKNGTTYAIAGRNQAKLDAILVKNDIKQGVLTIIADSSDEIALKAMLERTRVVISLVGPYSQHGEKLVKLCAEMGVHYADLTGEAPFCYKMINTYGRSAIESGAIIVNSCGFDSIPSDLTTFLAVQRLNVIPGAIVGSVKAVFSAKGGASGGTIASGMAILNEGTSEDFKVMQNPFALSPIPANHIPRTVIASSSTFRGKRAWGSFFVMAPHNTLIVRRTWGILAQAASSELGSIIPYGPKFQYEEVMKSPNRVVATITSIIIYCTFLALMYLQPLRWAVSRFGLQAGEGPSEKVQKEGWFKCETTALSTDSLNAVQVVMRGDIDPGYSGTARMIVECGLALAHDHAKLPLLARKGGFLTPALAFGQVLVDRLTETGTFEFDLQSDKKE